MQKTKSWGYVYILRCVDRFKIGYAGNLKTLSNRIRRLQTLNAYDVTPVLYLRSRRAHNLELELHRNYQDKKIHHEWFNLDESDISEIKNNYQNNLFFR